MYQFRYINIDQFIVVLIEYLKFVEKDLVDWWILFENLLKTIDFFMVTN